MPNPQANPGDDTPPVRLGELAAAIVAALPCPPGPRVQPAPRPAPGPVTDDPLVRAVLAAFPGAAIVSVHQARPCGRQPVVAGRMNSLTATIRPVAYVDRSDAAPYVVIAREAPQGGDEIGVFWTDDIRHAEGVAAFLRINGPARSAAVAEAIATARDAGLPLSPARNRLG